MRLLPTLLLALVLPAVAAPAAGARTWTAKVVSVDDGDTIHVDIDGDGSRRVFPVRFIAVQAMEQSVYSSHPARRRGQCHALEATARLEQLVRSSRRRVRLSAKNPTLRDAKGRLRRSVAVRIGGRWRDAGEKLISEGHALWLPAIDERRFNRAYNRAQQQAALRGRNLWDPRHCGSGPGQDVPLRVWASSDPLGNDEANVNGEWIKIRNLSPSQPLALGGWWVRDSNLRRFTLPGATTAGPGETVTVHVGSGADTRNAFHWGLPEPIFENANGDGRDLGDGAYLFDPRGDLRAWMLYPCVVACSDPNEGALAIEAHPQRPESVTVRNVSGRAVELYGYQLALEGTTWQFPEGSLLQPGQSLRVDVGEWDRGRYLLVDAGGSIRLKTFTQITLACDAWGSGSC